MAPAKTKGKVQKGKPRTTQPNGKSKEKKQRAYDRPTIALPKPAAGAASDESDPDLSEQEIDVLEDANVAFLTNLDQKGISRSKKETQRLHKLSKPARPKVDDGDLPSVEEHTDDESPWEEGEEDVLSEGNEDDSELDDSEVSDEEDEEDEDAGEASVPSGSAVSNSDIEQTYELKTRKRRRSWEAEGDDTRKAPGRLPIKLANGQLKKLKDLEGRPVPAPIPGEASSEEEESSSEDEDPSEQEEPRTNNVATGSRFGRPAPAAVLGLSSRAERVQKAKEQIAGICQEVMGAPEDGLGLLKRLLTFALPMIPSPTPGQPAVANDPLIRRLALLSLLRVFRDILPSYRIRELTEKEKAEKVGQQVARMREWEQGVVLVYRQYLGELEREVKGKRPETTAGAKGEEGAKGEKGGQGAADGMAATALKCLCEVMTSLTHFNFRTNVMSVVIGRVSRKSWDENSELCRQSIVHVFKEDTSGQASLELVRLLNRMVKERKYQVHPNVLSCLLHLRLKTELGRPAEKEGKGKGRHREEEKDGKKGKKKDRVHLSKKQKKALKETREIQKEMADAEAAVDLEERAKTHTETLKLLFVLYFSVLKAPSSRTRQSRLLPEALAGVSAFAHLINIDFFRDLLDTLRNIIREADGGDDLSGGGEAKDGETEEGTGGTEGVHQMERRARTKLLCVMTAFQLLTGQGEALNIDLTEFVNELYAVIPLLAFVVPLEADTLNPSKSTQKGPSSRAPAPQPLINLLLRALNLLFLPRHSLGTSRANPPARTLAFCKRLLTLTLHLPPAPAVRVLHFLQQLRAREPKTDILFQSSGDDDGEAGGGGDGVWRGDVDDPGLANAGQARGWEVGWLVRNGMGEVREAATALGVWKRS